MSEDKPTGQLFSHVYLERGAPVQDSELFRRRLGGFIEANHYGVTWELSNFIKLESGLTVPKIPGHDAWFYQYEDFFVNIKIPYVLNAITLIWRYLFDKYTISSREGNYSPQANDWHDFVERAFKEENLGYTLDSRCGVHFLVDQEFEHNRLSVLRCLNLPRYAGVRDAFDAAHRYFDFEQKDTKAAVRAMFESIEILSKIMVTGSRRLNKSLVEGQLKQMALGKYAGNETAIATVGKTFDGIAQWVDALHNYRHGQGEEEPVEPPLEYAVYVISSGAAILRWLLEIDTKQSTTGA